MPADPPAVQQPDPGLRPGPVSEWLRGALDLALPVQVEQVAGGRSNLTYRVTDAAGRQVALRRPPRGQLLQTAHDMRREWAALRAVEGGGVPAPRPLALCEDPTVTGAPFYVMQWLDGLVPADAQAAQALSLPARAELTRSLPRVLAALHALDPVEVGLGGWARPGSYLERQRRRWLAQVRASGTAHLALAERVHDALRPRGPDAPYAIVHGDFRAGNVLVGPDGQVRAVLDWELATLGPPLADLGWLLASWSGPGQGELAPVTATPSTLPGFGSREDLIEVYAGASGSDLTGLPLWEAFARWRSACINAGVRARYLAGVMGDDGFDPSGMDDQLHGQLELAADLLSRLPRTGG